MTQALPLGQALLRAESVTPAHGTVFDIAEAALAAQGFRIDRFVAGDAPDGPVENMIAVRGGTGAAATASARSSSSMIRSATITPCGPPKPRKAVFETVFVRSGWLRTSTSG